MPSVEVLYTVSNSACSSSGGSTRPERFFEGLPAVETGFGVD